MDRARRILDLCYMIAEVTCDSGKDVGFRYHRCIPNSRESIEGFDAV